jgi:hypothetical protein
MKESSNKFWDVKRGISGLFEPAGHKRRQKDFKEGKHEISGNYY